MEHCPAFLYTLLPSWSHRPHIFCHPTENRRYIACCALCPFGNPPSDSNSAVPPSISNALRSPDCCEDIITVSISSVSRLGATRLMDSSLLFPFFVLCIIVESLNIIRMLWIDTKVLSKAFLSSITIYLHPILSTYQAFQLSSS